MKKVRLGVGAGYWPALEGPAIEICEKGDVDYIGFEYLAELTMSILQRTKDKDSTKGYIPHLIPDMKAILPTCVKKGIKIITNGGGVNPEGAADAIIKVCKELGISGLKIGIVLGDDLRDKIDDFLAKGIKLRNLDTGEEEISRIKDKIVAANAYIGADSIIRALQEGCQIVITGRASDNALYVGPLMYEFGWDYRDPYWEKIGAAITIGHIIECADAVCGCMSAFWEEAPELWKVGHPIAECYEDGTAIITKVEGSGGMITEWTVKEHLVYEVHNPREYLMPDGIADFTTLKQQEIGKDRVLVTNMTGKPRPKDLKVQIGYRDTFVAEGLVILPWPKALTKAKKAQEILLHRWEMHNVHPLEYRFDYVGLNALHGPVAPMPDDEDKVNEVGLRVVCKCKTREEAEMARLQISHLWTLGGVGTAFGVPYNVRPIIALWPTLVPREEVPTQLIIKEV